MIEITGYRFGGVVNGGWAKGKPNSAGGWDIQLRITNNYDKVIKYIYFNFAAYNGVGDRVCCTARGENVVSGSFTGPLEPGKHTKYLTFDTMFYNNSIKDIKIEKVEIEFMDGTKDEVDGASLSIGEGSGCYVATCVYGSYNCPQVWTLRRYRDNVLASTWYGRAFVHTYYAISPTIVRLFGNTRWFKKFWKSKLDKMVLKLQIKGFEDTPYNDKKW